VVWMRFARRATFGSGPPRCRYPPTVIHAPAFGNAGHTFPAPKMKTWRTRVISRSDDPVSPILPHDIENVRDITQLLHGARHGDPVAEERLMECIYSELHQLATKFLSGERVDHTLQPTALVNEAYLKLFGKKVTPWENRAHFYVSAARTMRRILVDYARAGAAVKRPSRQDRVEMSNVLALVRERSAEFIALDQALERLASWDERQAKIVELRFYCGLTVEETAAALGISEKTVKRDWSSARAWLQAQVNSVIS
jgi:RNA polymerase sigma-70 factor (ECF subfamily)